MINKIKSFLPFIIHVTMLVNIWFFMTMYQIVKSFFVVFFNLLLLPIVAPYENPLEHLGAWGNWLIHYPAVSFKILIEGIKRY